MSTVKEFIVKHGLSMIGGAVAKNPNMDGSDMMHNWRVMLLRKEGSRTRTMTTYYSMGFGHNGKEPDLDDVLDCLASDARSTDVSFEEWSREFGYDEDSRKAERIYKACVKSAKKLKTFLGADKYNALLQSEEG